MVLDFPQGGGNSNFFLNVTWVTGQSSLLILYFQRIVGNFFMGRSAAPSFKTSLDTAWRVWFNLTETVGSGGSHIDFNNVQPRFVECAEAITSAVTALRMRAGSINETHRNTIDKILNGAKGEEGIPDLPSLRKLLKTCEKALTLNESDRAIWNATAKEVRKACDRLAQTISPSDGR